MKRGLGVVILGCACFLLVFASVGSAQDPVTISNQVTSELQASGKITPEVAKAIKSCVEDIASKGATKNDLKNILVELSANGINGSDFKRLLDSMNGLMIQGESPKEVFKVVSLAIIRAQGEVLKGNEDIADKVDEALAQRKK